MACPLFFLIILGAIVVFAVIVAIYLQIYKKNINRALRAGNEATHTMAPPHRVLVITAILLLIITTIASYFAGYKTAYDRIENKTPASYAQGDCQQQTFYAQITGITGSLEGGNCINVSGLPVNDINFRGDFSFAIIGETSLEWRGTPLEFSELEAGDTISITFTGEVIEKSPAIIKHVVKIQLLDDEK